MIQQSVLPFKLKMTGEKITARSGLALFTELIKALGVDKALKEKMPSPGSGRGFHAHSYVLPILMTLYGGGTTIEDIRELRLDKPLLEACGLKHVPSSSAIGDWLKRVGTCGGIGGIESVADGIVKRVLKKDDGNDYTLIADPTIIQTEKHSAKMTYLGFKGYRPVVASIKELDLALAYEFKEGNHTGDKIAILKKAFSKMPAGKRIQTVLLDGEYYMNEVIEFLNEKGVNWLVAADKDEAVIKAIETISDEDWKPFLDKFGNETEREVANTVHTTREGKEAFTLTVTRWKTGQGDLFRGAYNYHAIATNMFQKSAAQVVLTYNERANIENNIKELKSGFGMEYLPSGDFSANAVWFGLGVMAYNLFLAQKLLTMPEDWRTKTIKSIRWLFVSVAGRVGNHSRQLYLKIAACSEKYRQYRCVRRRTYALSLE